MHVLRVKSFAGHLAHRRSVDGRVEHRRAALPYHDGIALDQPHPPVEQQLTDSLRQRAERADSGSVPPREAASIGAARSEPSARSICSARHGSGTTATSSSTSVQMPPRPITTAGVTASARTASSSSSPAAPCARPAPRRRARPPARPADVGRADGRFASASPRTTPPSSDLWCTRRRAQLQRDLAAELVQRRAASSSSATARPSIRWTPAPRSSSLGLMFGHPLTGALPPRAAHRPGGAAISRSRPGSRACGAHRRRAAHARCATRRPPAPRPERSATRPRRRAARAASR